MSLPTALEVITLVMKESLHLRLSSMSAKNLRNSGKYEMDHCIHLIVMYQDMQYLVCSRLFDVMTLVGCW